MPSHSDYQPLLQDDIDDELDPQAALASPLLSPRIPRRIRERAASVDLGKLDVAFKKWTESIAQKMKALGKKKRENLSVKKEISRSVFDPPVPPTPLPAEVKTLDHEPPMSHQQFLDLVSSVKTAIVEGHHPKMISKGSSGSYFSKAKVDGKYQTVGVFKPKDEEPYGRLNPKTTKWLHRKLRWIIPFGRACLIPNLSYISEAAASLLDTRLNLNIVPKTELVSLSSPTFYYDWIDRSGARKGKPLPEKIGSMQFFMHGFQDASEFLRRHPLPDRSISDTYDDSTHRQPNISKRMLSALSLICGRAGEEPDDGYDLDEEDDEHVTYGSESPDRPFHWTPLLLQSLREELEKLVILDYLMRNTDRGSDNYMIRVCDANHERPLVDVAPTRAERPQMPVMSELRAEGSNVPSMSSGNYLPRTGSANQSYQKHAHVHIAAIDNSLSFPHEHPRGWRNYTYGWLFLPVSVIGRPFSDSVRKQILPILTSKAWWEETTFELRKLFELDPGFHPSMFRRQLAVIKGQAWNIVQCLKHSDEGPLELTRRTKVLVWDDEIEVPHNAPLSPYIGPITSSPLVRPNDLPGPPERPRRKGRSVSLTRDFPPPMRRSSTDASGLTRPVSFSVKFPRINPGASGVAVLEHLERLDAVEAGLMRLGEGDTVPEEDEEVDLGLETRQAGPSKTPEAPSIERQGASPTFEDEEADQVGELSMSVTHLQDDETENGDLGQMSQSLPHLGTPQRVRWASERSVLSGPESRLENFDWFGADQDEREGKMKTVIVERLETVGGTSFFTCW